MAEQVDFRRERRTRLSRERVLRAALDLADQRGIEALTMRGLAKELGVEAMSLYNHVANKGDLVAGIVDLVLGEIELPDDGDWDVAIRRCAISAHDALLRHTWACSLVIAPGTAENVLTPRTRYMEWLLGRLRAGGFSADLTYHAYHALDSHILGFTMWQLGHSAAASNVTEGKDPAEWVAGVLRQFQAADYRYLAEHVEQHMNTPSDGGASEFEFSLDLILDGLRRLRDAE